jgi:hypothetical protein
MFCFYSVLNENVSALTYRKRSQKLVVLFHAFSRYNIIRINSSSVYTLVEKVLRSA